MIQGSYTTRQRVGRRSVLHTAVYVAAGLLAVGLTGCNATHLATSVGYSAVLPIEDNAPRPVDNEVPLVEQRLREAEADWHGTPYRYGGASRDGIDCSAFVMTIYKDLFDLALPRTTLTQVETGEEVSPDALQAGDLVFFRTSRKTRHVGIYLGAGEFAHASTSQGVMTSRLDNSYWQRTYWTARRILPTAPVAASADAPPAVQKNKPSPARRTGW